MRILFRILFIILTLSLLACSDPPPKSDSPPVVENNVPVNNPPDPGVVEIVLRNAGDRGVTYFESANAQTAWIEFLDGDQPIRKEWACGAFICGEDGHTTCRPGPPSVGYLAAGNQVSSRWGGAIWVFDQDRGCDEEVTPPQGTTIEVRVCWGDSVLDDIDGERPALVDCQSQTLTVGATTRLEFEIQPMQEDFSRLASSFTLQNSSGDTIYLQDISQCQANAFFRIIENDEELNTNYGCFCECGVDCADCPLECPANTIIELADGESRSFFFRGSHFLSRGQCGYIIAPASDELEVEVCFGASFDSETQQVNEPSCVMASFAPGEDVTLTID